MFDKVIQEAGISETWPEPFLWVNSYSGGYINCQNHHQLEVPDTITRCGQECNQHIGWSFAPREQLRWFSLKYLEYDVISDLYEQWGSLFIQTFRLSFAALQCSGHVTYMVTWSLCLKGPFTFYHCLYIHFSTRAPCIFHLKPHKRHADSVCGLFGVEIWAPLLCVFPKVKCGHLKKHYFNP